MTSLSPNMKGTAIGGIVASVVLSILTKAGYIAAITSAVALSGATEADKAELASQISGAIVIAVTCIGNYFATHTALKKVEDMIPTVDPSYPNDPKTPSNVSNINKG